jgi:hypothetical protein
LIASKQRQIRQHFPHVPGPIGRPSTRSAESGSERCRRRPGGTALLHLARPVADRWSCGRKRRFGLGPPRAPRLRDAWLFGLQLDSDSVGEPTPRLLRLDKPAFALFGEIQHEARRRARSSRGLAAGWHGKMPGRVLRLARLRASMLRSFATNQNVSSRGSTTLPNWRAR